MKEEISMMDNGEIGSIESEPQSIKSSFSGFLEKFHLTEIIQFLTINKKQGELIINNGKPGSTASVFIEADKIIHAQYQQQKGLKAMELILGIEKGYFKFFPDRFVQEQTINQEAIVILMNIQRRIDEIRHLREIMPSSQSIPAIVPNITKIPELTTCDWQILSLINGRRTIQRICEKADDELMARKTLNLFFSNGLLTCQSTESSWKEIVPLINPITDNNAQRHYPPRLRTNLLLKAIDGKKTLYSIFQSLHMSENDFFEDLKLLYDLNWIQFPQKNQQETFIKFVADY
jgi:hypothetical protein